MWSSEKRQHRIGTYDEALSVAAEFGPLRDTQLLWRPSFLNTIDTVWELTADQDVKPAAKPEPKKKVKKDESTGP